jgi:hypothetical protein
VTLITHTQNSKLKTHNFTITLASALICLLATTACSDDSPTRPSPVSRQVVLAPGQTAAILEGGVSIRFQEVAGDSRCPATAICVWSGDALVRVEVIPLFGGRQTYDLHTADRRAVTHEDLTIALVELAPYPLNATPIPQADYRATLRVTR